MRWQDGASQDSWMNSRDINTKKEMTSRGWTLSYFVGESGVC